MGTRCATRKYMFFTNNYALFHLWLKENLVKHQRVSKYYDYDFLHNFFLLLLMSLLTAPVVKSSHILAGIFFTFLKNAQLYWDKLMRG